MQFPLLSPCDSPVPPGARPAAAMDSGQLSAQALDSVPSLPLRRERTAKHYPKETGKKDSRLMIDQAGLAVADRVRLWNHKGERLGHGPIDSHGQRAQQWRQRPDVRRVTEGLPLSSP